MKIRAYKDTDYKEILGWWNDQKEMAPIPEMMPLDSSYILEINGMPVLAVSLFLTNTKEACYVENFVGNPNFKNAERKAASHVLLSHLEDVAKELGYKRLICFGYQEKLKNRYEELGFKSTVHNLTSYTKEL